MVLREDFVGPTSGDELKLALDACNFALVVWLPPGVVALANPAAGELVGRSPDALVGVRIVDLLGPRDAVEEALKALNTGVVESVRTERTVIRPSGEPTDVWVWSRSVEVDNRLTGLSLISPVDQIARLGRDPAAPWRDLAEVTIGFLGRDLRVLQVSSNVSSILGYKPDELVGKSILDLIDSSGVATHQQGADGTIEVDSLPCRVHMRHRTGRRIDVRLLIGTPTGREPVERVFALVGPPPENGGSTSDRVAELELRLRRIAVEVQAAGVMEGVRGLPSPSEIPELGELTSRQWEVLSRLMRGERVPTIADGMFLSQGTVRNYLAAIFRKFGVHSQRELLERLSLPEHRQA